MWEYASLSLEIVSFTVLPPVISLLGIDPVLRRMYFAVMETLLAGMVNLPPEMPSTGLVVHPSNWYPSFGVWLMLTLSPICAVGATTTVPPPDGDAALEIVYVVLTKFAVMETACAGMVNRFPVMVSAGLVVQLLNSYPVFALGFSVTTVPGVALPEGFTEQLPPVPALTVMLKEYCAVVTVSRKVPRICR